MSIFTNVQLTPADLPQPPAPQVTTNAGSGGSSDMDFYPPGGAHASPHPNYHAQEIAPVFGGGGMG